MDMNSHLPSLSLNEVGLLENVLTTTSCELDFGKSSDLGLVSAALII